MNLLLKKSLAAAVFSFLFFEGSGGFCQNLSSKEANRKTAVRYLKVCEQHAAGKDWTGVDSAAELGLAFDESVSDLWYMRAVAKSAMNFPEYQVLPLVEKSLLCDQWVDYNRDTARVLYADLLCTTRNFEQALEILDGEGFLYSADAEFIRSKVYYGLGTDESVEKARNKIDSARRIYPEDLRFAELFFSHEYALGGRNEKNSRLADSFIKIISKNSSISPELEIYSAVFSSGEEKFRRLRAFEAKNLHSPLFLLAAMDGSGAEGELPLLTDVQALDYFYSFADEKLDYDFLKKFAGGLKEPEVLREFGEYLNQYSGVIFRDTDGDLIFNMEIDYSRGRPQKIIYDENQDKMAEWIADCDFGVPLALSLPGMSIELEYGTWPSVSRAVYRFDGEGEFSFFLVPDLLFWSPFSISADEEILEFAGAEFFVPSVLKNAENISARTLLLSSSSCSIPSDERKNARVVYSLLDGKPQFARFYEGEKMYAQLLFKDGVPESRTVDMDGDGFFELTETYGVLPSEEKTAAENLSQPSEIAFPSLPVVKIQVDLNGDTIADYTEEYTGGDGKVCLWDLEGDGKWDIRYEKCPADSDGSLVEKSTFFKPLSNVSVTVVLKDGNPVSVLEGEKNLKITEEPLTGIYWLEEAGSSEDSEKILKTFNQNGSETVYIIVENEQKRMFAVKNGRHVFAQILPDKN